MCCKLTEAAPVCNIGPLKLASKWQWYIPCNGKSHIPKKWKWIGINTHFWTFTSYKCLKLLLHAGVKKRCKLRLLPSLNDFLEFLHLKVLSPRCCRSWILQLRSSRNSSVHNKHSNFSVSWLSLSSMVISC